MTQSSNNKSAVKKKAPTTAFKTVETAQGARLLQDGAVLSVALRKPGPTHSVFDVLGSLIRLLCPGPRLAILGFAGGGLLAPMRQLGCRNRVVAVDLSAEGYEVFKKHSSHWAGDVTFHHAEAQGWLSRQRGQWDMILEDLSMAQGGEVMKPDICWTTLPAIIRESLKPGGIALFNLLTPAEPSWVQGIAHVSAGHKTARVVTFDDYENRMLVVGPNLPTAHELSHLLYQSLARLNSRQAGRCSVETVR
ncbi:MAG TPA: class I SAM-dependent methyltransferase [Roseimicrobium sp.]|nr:class I SAM-dependent methyltransferase [Roseimicrobium sp.]